MNERKSYPFGVAFGFYGLASFEKSLFGRFGARDFRF